MRGNFIIPKRIQEVFLGRDFAFRESKKHFEVFKESMQSDDPKIVVSWSDKSFRVDLHDAIPNLYKTHLQGFCEDVGGELKITSCIGYGIGPKLATVFFIIFGLVVSFCKGEWLFGSFAFYLLMHAEGLVIRIIDSIFNYPREKKLNVFFGRMCS